MKRLLILTAVTAVAVSAGAQSTTYGGDNAPYAVDGGYVSDYSPDGTVLLADGSVTLSNGAIYEHGNNLLQNNGSWTATTGSLDLFQGTGNQTISGSVAPDFFNIHFNNGAGNIMAITNTQGIHIAGQAQFSNGITTTVRSTAYTGAVHFADGAAYTGANTDAQHVDGYVSKAGNSAFTFPVGSGTDLRILSITAPATVGTVISTAWFEGDPGTIADPSDGGTHSTAAVAAPLQAVSTAGFWDWIPVSGSDDGLTVTVSIPDLSGFAGSGDLVLAGWDGTQWIDLSASATASGNTENSTLSGTIPAGTAITAIGIGSLGMPLPILFSDFDVAKDGCKALLKWSTAMEHNNDHFEIERSADGRNFSVIGTIPAIGDSDGPQSYSYSDAQPQPGVNYYRIKQVDIDGKRSSTAIKSLYFDCSKGIVKVYPTLTDGTLYIDMPTGYEHAKISIIDMNGRKVNAAIPVEGLFRVVRMSAIAAGAYLLRIDRGNDVQTFKILYRP